MNAALPSTEPEASPQNEPDVLVCCSKVAHTYGTGVTAVEAVTDISCLVTTSTRVAITGPSGSGKSTLLHLMAGLEIATAGVMEWPGLGGRPLARPGRIGIVFQGPSLLPALDAMENVAFPLLLAGTSDLDARELALAALQRLRIADLAAKLPQELSGGQSQRVAVARVIAANPSLILADEPTGQLDHHAASLVMDLLLQAADELGAGLVVSTHDPVVAARLPEIWRMRDGRMLAPATTIPTPGGLL
ncbi:ATP-binding cassette domain-containing protein [Nakamurella antarctica]|uniref:ATP-binding cassette domain-containing protein n=1 Tax=Nakamurella antarctica TaxID=1902245 RepID=A0A3G8ZNT3_9ACTN|nr:ATP-binding cassette domain-containing protein [Nakamurella antarctica]AZI58798.1 ATP-binding cassette domain-containing protein [Nakamurella antarctica]